MMAERDFKTGAVQIGDLLGAVDSTAVVFTPGAPRWYALRVAPQREEQAEVWLKKRGVYSFHPVLLRRSVRFGKAVEFQRRYLPGYVFARFPGAPVVHHVRTCGFILGALARQDGVWGILEPERLAALHAMRATNSKADARRTAEIVRRRRVTMAQVGGGALFRGGAFAGQRCEVVELAADGGAKVRMALFGGEVLVSARIEDLEALPKTC